jgi:Ran GTPase-activating protein (RanGAP) involved in mRNA processing and transport
MQSIREGTRTAKFKSIKSKDIPESVGAIAQSTSLESLDLSGCLIKDEDVQKIATAISDNPSLHEKLTTLNFAKNHTQAGGAEAILTRA